MLKITNKFDSATAADKGARDYQEDSLIVNFHHGQETGFAVLSDGMGGHFSGNIASALVMSEVFTQLKMQDTKLACPETDIPALLENAAKGANDQVKQYMSANPESYGMGATLLATLIRGDELYWVSIGDSPLYLFRDGALSQLNQDHSMAPQIDMMVKVGAMSEEVGRDHPDRSTLTSAISGKEIARIDCPDTPTNLREGDIVITASDGLQYLSNDKITEIVTREQSEPSTVISQALLTALEEKADPDQDNIAFSVLKLGVCKPLEKPQRERVTEPSVIELPHASRANVSDVEATSEQAGPADAAPDEPSAVRPDIPARRVIRLVTSETMEFKKFTPDATTQDLAIQHERRRVSHD